MRFTNFSEAIDVARDRLRHAPIVHPDTWQAVDVSAKPEMATYEITDLFFTVSATPYNLIALQNAVQPNLPWADEHFYERVGGSSLNPPPSYKTWPWGHSAEKFLKKGKFSHTYPERLWAKHANQPTDKWCGVNQGVRFALGDLQDVVTMLAKHPLSRQAYIPIWFPEDTGAAHGERVPCTLGYFLMMRGGFLHLSYFIRSCDYLRHFRDDIYLSVRLQMWVLDELKRIAPDAWGDVRLGNFNMWVGSLHLFKNDYRMVFDGVVMA